MGSILAAQSIATLVPALWPQIVIDFRRWELGAAAARLRGN